MSRIAQMPHFVSMAHALVDRNGFQLKEDSLPTSVRGAPSELRRIIRKRQNSESAKRCRQRKKIENALAAEEIMTQAAKVEHLETVVQYLAQRLQETQALVAAITGPSTCSPITLSPSVSTQQRSYNVEDHVLCNESQSVSMPSDTPMSAVSDDLQMSLSLPTTDRLSASHDAAAHSLQELHMALGNRKVHVQDDAAAMARRVDEIGTSTWQ